MRWFKFLAVAAVGVLLINTIQSPAKADKYEQPVYQVERSDGDIEIRRYPAQLAAEVTTTGNRKAAINEGFRVLAAFIFGKNTVSDKIAMTTPVIQEKAAQPATEREGEKIAMTAPVTQQAKGHGDSDEGQSWTTRFFMPSPYTKATLPKPNNDQIRIVETAPQRVAVIRFAGTSSEQNLAAHQQQLDEFIASQRLRQVGEPTYAFYNPPFTLPMLRRNEIMVTLSE